jgi:DNA polymerase elongation subunit (family B)
MDFTSSNGSVNKRHPNEALDNVNDIREYDVPYYVRVAIDNGKS